MLRRTFVLALLWIQAVAYASGRAQSPAGAPELTGAAAADAAFVKQYCATCHNSRLRTGGLALDAMNPADVGPHAETWEKVVRKLRTGMMPPAGAPRPTRAAFDAFAASLEGRLDRAAAAGRSLVTPALHRLNRAEYTNAIRDLLDLDVDVSTLLPSDDSNEGFDNVAEALGVSPSLIQGYVSAATKISRLAVGDRTAAAAQVTYAAPPGLVQDRHLDGLPLGTRGGLLVRHTFPLDAEYEFTVGGAGQAPGAAGPPLDVTIDDERVTVQNPRRFRIPVTAGPHTIAVAIVDRQRGAGVDEVYSDFRTANGGFTTAGAVQNIGILGPFNPRGPGDTPSRRRIFECRPASAADEQRPTSAMASTRSRRSSLAAQADGGGCARRIVKSLARRAYRGPVSAAEIDTLMSFYQQGRQDGGFESGIQMALARILVAPRFIYRIEEEPGAVAPGGIYRISDNELASRLSFFLWSSIPDEELLELASKNRLRDPATLAAQVRRMLADPKAGALIDNFAGQWLYLRELANLQTEAPGFDENLRRAFRKETELLFGTIVREDRSLIELLDADYTFVDERLARHYGIPGVRGSHFRRIQLPADSLRRGLLGHGSMLTVTSVTNRTSPVSRGKWILENLLGAPPPEPPPGVETNLDEAQQGSVKPTTLRQRLEIHRANPTCASCHRIMDPIGFALENFDLIGAWRETDAGMAIDATGQLADGTAVKGPSDLRHAVLERSEAFMTTAAEKLLMYALGRPVHYYDMPIVRAVVRRATREGNRFSAIVLGIVESDPFQKRVKTPGKEK